MLLRFLTSAMSEGGKPCPLRRLEQLKGVLSWQPKRVTIRQCSSSSSKGNDKGYTVDIGGTTVEVVAPKNVHLVPVNRLPATLSQSLLHHLKWMLQKDKLGQDMFLIGPPGPTRRQLAMMFCELLQKEVEYVSLSRDTTESDLKQRREIREGTAEYINQSAVRAALEGRVLVLEGIEKAERNVLPVLNNLLENREMLLEDGRFLVAPDRYDKLLKSHSNSELDKWKLERVHESFRVIALGLPVPPYRGNPLDPPLRSRFQSRVIQGAPFQEQLAHLQVVAPNATRKKLSAMLSIATTLQTLSGSTHYELMDFPLHHLEHLARILNVLPEMDVISLLQFALPVDVLGKQEMFYEAAKKFGESPQIHGAKCNINETSPNESYVHLSLDTPHGSAAMELKGYPHLLNNQAQNVSFVENSEHNKILSEMMLSHNVGDFCIVGEKGTGKTTLAHKFASLLGYSPETIVLYQDMTSRDLLQQRMTLPNGDTGWRLAPLVRAAMDGKCVILDGVHRADMGTLAVLKRLAHDRELSLFGGERLVHETSYNALKEKMNIGDDKMREMGIFPISDKFRMIALGEPPTKDGDGGVMTNPEFLSMFLFHHLKPLTLQNERELIASKVPTVPEDKLNQLLSLVSSLRTSQDQMGHSLANSLSTRQLLRICKRLAVNKDECLHQVVNKACLSRFIPSLAKSALEKAMEDVGIVPSHHQYPSNQNTSSYSTDGGVLSIGGATHQVNISHKHTALVPDVLFYDNQQHTEVMEDMLKDFSLGEHLLLVGNQGVGKNKIVDRFLHLLNLPREYLQLHRDTTVQTLTLQSSVRDGQIIYEDSPLVRAVREGLVLVVDEADKAPTHVTCVLKNLIERGEMTLADGRRIVPSNYPESHSPTSIPIHPDFRMVVLANRPGFPFLGNDFFAAMGDMFSCHAIDNPDFESELIMMKQYGPDVPESTLRKIVKAFAELREMADQGLISYPYSTREVVNIVRHLQLFPSEPISNIVQNVFGFDSYDKDLVTMVAKTLHKHGVPVGGSPSRIQLAEQKPLPRLKLTSKLKIESGSRSIPVSSRSRPITLKGPHHIDSCYYPLEKMEVRGVGFSETKSKWLLPMDETNYVTGLAVGRDDHGSDDIIHVATGNPLGVYSMSLHGPSIHHVDLGWYFPLSMRPQLSAAALHGDHTGKVLLHEHNSNSLLVVDPKAGDMWIPDSDSLTGKISKHFASNQRSFKMLSQFSNDNVVILYEDKGTTIKVLDFDKNASHEFNTPMNIVKLMPVAIDQWLIQDGQEKCYLLNKQNRSSPIPDSIHEVNTTPVSGGVGSLMQSTSTSGPSPVVLKESLNMEVDENTPRAYSRLACCQGDVVAIATGFPMKDGRAVSVFGTNVSEVLGGSRQDGHSQSSPTFIPDQSQVFIPSISIRGVGVVDVFDLGRHTHSEIPLQKSVPQVQFWSGQHRLYSSVLSDSSVVVADAVGNVTVLETGYELLQRSLNDWKQMIGSGDGQPLQLTIDRESGEDVSSPKHGKVDPDNDPHVGGNTWAGGTGGRDTAGLGGMGGPYRLDAGHNVFQVSDAEKDNVPEEVKRAAREMGQRAFQKRLEEIKMSPHDADLYAKLKSSVQNQIHSIRVILEGLQAKALERQWIKHQTSGDLDDSKLIDGLTGERSIYKRRGEKEPEYGSPQLLPKRIKLVVDVSGSMYRFNGHDRRLDRMISAVLMVMEAFDKHDRKFKIDITGHSGDSPDIKFVSSATPPSNDKERLTVLEMMHAHSQFCWTGDNTLEATQLAVKEITKEPADEYFVVVVSDANFSRYGINPKDFSTIMTKDPNVNVFAIFIGSLGDQAQKLKKSLPGGRTFICMDNRDLPQILQQIFTATLK